MKFADIEPFKQCNDNGMRISLKRINGWMEDMEKDGMVFEMNPDFQRGHVWTEDQQSRYVEFLLRQGKSGREIYFNCPEWGRWDSEATITCVDGLQRITACQRFMNNEIPAFGHYLKEYDDEPNFTSIGLTVYINNLQTKKGVIEWYLEMNFGGTPHEQSELDRVKKILEGLK